MARFFFACKSQEVESIAQTTSESHDALMRIGPVDSLVLFGAASLGGCASLAPASSSGAAPADAPTGPQGAEDGAPGSSNLSLGSAPRQTTHPLLDDREPRPELALPRLTYKHWGMHIGGESNSAESKRPWFDDIERHEDAILSCYRWVNDPLSGGSFGVDLFVASQGGSAEVRGSRQKLGGEELDRCMREAFVEINFHRPERPTVLSYSILFEWEDSSASHRE